MINLVQQEIADEAQERELIQLIETIIIYKFPQKSREEIEQMLGLGELKQTKVYQEALEEGIEEGERRGRLQGKLESVPQLLALGLTVEQISQALDLDVEQVRQAASPSPESEKRN